MQRSEIGLLLELGQQNYSYPSSHLDRNCRFSVLNSSSTAATELMRTNPRQNHQARSSVASRGLNS
eukprot:4622437-Pyramimonas_sp.AAC.1